MHCCPIAASGASYGRLNTKMATSRILLRIALCTATRATSVKSHTPGGAVELPRQAARRSGTAAAQTTWILREPAGPREAPGDAPGALRRRSHPPLPAFAPKAVDHGKCL